MLMLFELQIYFNWPRPAFVYFKVTDSFLEDVSVDIDLYINISVSH